MGGKFSGLSALRDKPAKSTVAAPKSNSGFAVEGKRSNPEYRQVSVLMRIETRRKADDVLRRMDDGTDLADLIQHLLEQWLSSKASGGDR